jgi:hypothetical protein
VGCLVLLAAFPVGFFGVAVFGPLGLLFAGAMGLVGLLMALTTRVS